ncbi:PqqD family protein, partial [Sphaerisporangium rufum]|uniref:PqqD family protein n=1 Tax=Sphaerisporangium rufum TaxID=1381558 RepID=UPI00194DF4A9
MSLPDGRISIGLMQQGVAAEIQDDVDGSIARLIALMDGTRTVEEIGDAFARTHPGVAEADLREVIQGLIDNGFVEDAAAPLPANLTTREAERYESARNFFAWIDTRPRSSPYEIQSKIKDARVALLG